MLNSNNEDRPLFSTLLVTSADGRHSDWAEVYQSSLNVHFPDGEVDWTFVLELVCVTGLMYSFGWPGTPEVEQDGLELKDFLSLSPKSWD